MAISIRNPAVEAAIVELASLKRTSKTKAVREAIENELRSMLAATDPATRGPRFPDMEKPD